MRIMILFLLLLSMPAFASEPELLGEYQKWQVYHYQESNGPVCYAMTHADKTTDAKGKNLKIKDRGRVLLEVTRRVAEGDGLVVSFIAGHTIKTKTDVLATVGKAHFHLRGDGDTAWTNNPSDDTSIAQAIRKAKTITIAHEGRKGMLVMDDFPAKGAVAALDALGHCE